MITYELAEELKDNGFPQDWKITNEGYYLGYLGVIHEVRTKHQKEVYVPTLSELIEACGHVRLDYFPNGKSFANCCDIHAHQQVGSTPEEAVARLYVVMHKK